MSSIHQKVVSAITVLGFTTEIATACPIPIFPRSAVLCIPGPASWQTVALFYLLNYISHAATIKSLPGDTWRKSIASVVRALLYPFSGICRACEAIARSKLRGESQLDHALRAKGLCCVIRTQAWKPQTGMIVKGCRVLGISSRPGGGTLTGTVLIDPLYDATEQSCNVSPKTENIHGQVVLPDGYALQILPKYVSVSPLTESSSNPRVHHELSICCSHNVLKWIASILQLCFACSTLYRTRGTQIGQYGYAAFGLTVIPYAIMSLVNFIANISTPDYPYLYLVFSEVMMEAESRGARFDGVIARVDVDDHWKVHALQIQATSADTAEVSNIRAGLLVTGVEISFNDPLDLVGNVEDPPSVIVPSAGRYVQRLITKSEEKRGSCAWVIGVIALIMPYVIIGALTGFHVGSSTNAQRGWTMGWLISGQFFGICLGYVYMYSHKTGEILFEILIFAFLGIASIGGFIVVGQMLSTSGSCILE